MAKYRYYDFLGGLDIPVSQSYGDNVERYKELTRNPQTGISSLVNGHEGTDFSTLNGTKLYGPFEKAIVVRDGIDAIGWKNYGNFTVLWDPVQKIAFWFCHLEKFLFNLNDVVGKGQVFALTNNTGNSTGPHVHVNLCETNINGLRLHQDNGSLGFLNLMDKELIECVPMNLQVGQPSKPALVDETQSVTLQLTIPPADNIEQYMGIKKDDFTNMRVKCDAYDPILSAGFVNITAIDEKIQKLIQEKADMQKGYEEALAKANASIIKLAEENKEMVEQKENILNSWRADVKKDSPTFQEGLNAMNRVQELEQTVRSLSNAIGAKKPTEYFLLSKVDELLNGFDYFKRKAQKTTDEQSTTPSTETKNSDVLAPFIRALGVSFPILFLAVIAYYLSSFYK